MNVSYLKEIIDVESIKVTSDQRNVLKDVTLIIEDEIGNEIDLQRNEGKNSQIIKQLAIITEKLTEVIDRVKNDPNAKERFLESYPQWKKVRKHAIEQLKEIAKSLQEDRAKYNALKLIGYSTSFVGGTLGLASAFLIPFSFGLSTPLSILGGSMLAAGSVTALGTSVTESIQVKTQVDKAQKIINEDKEYFQGMSSWLEHTADLQEALAEILRIDIVKDICDSVKKLVARSMDIREHSARFKYIEENLKSILKYTCGKWKDVSASTIAALIFPLVTLLVLLCKIDNRLVFDWATLTVKGLISIVQLADDAYDVVQLSHLLNINAVMGKALLHSAVAALGISVDLAGVALTSIDLYKGSCCPEAENMKKAAEEMESEAIELEKNYKNMSKIH